jgi:hypothetical protein
LCKATKDEARGVVAEGVYHMMVFEQFPRARLTGDGVPLSLPMASLVALVLALPINAR